MLLLNLGAGATRPPSPWINIDDLFSQLPVGSVARKNLEAETNYVNRDIGKDLPFEPESFDGILSSHVFEHFDAQDAAALVERCYRVLKPGGVLLVSVPNATYFRKVHARDCNKNWPELFGVSDPPNPIPSWFLAALWFSQHKQVFAEDSLWALLRRGGFEDAKIKLGYEVDVAQSAAMDTMKLHINRVPFSLIMHATK